MKKTPLHHINGAINGVDMYCDVGLTFKVQELAYYERIQAGSEYCFTVSAISILMIIALGKHKRLCVESQSYAEKTSLGMLFMICTMDLCITLVNFQFLAEHPDWFDYMVISCLWSFFVYAIV